MVEEKLLAKNDISHSFGYSYPINRDEDRVNTIAVLDLKG